MTYQDLSINKMESTQEETSSAKAHGVESDVTLLDILIEIASRKWLVAKVAAFCILLGALLCFILPVRYTATTKIMPPQQTQSAASIMMSQIANSTAGSLAAIAGGGLSLKNPNEIYVGLIESRPIADTIIRKFNLVNVYHSRDMTAARKKLASNTVVDSNKSGFITVAVTDGDKQRAAAMANTYIEELRSLTNSLSVTEASRRRLFYEDQLKQAKEMLISAQLAFQQVQQKNGLVQLDSQAKAMIESLAALRAQVAAKQVELQALRLSSTENNPQVEVAKRELSSLQGEVAQLEQRSHSSQEANLGLGDVPGAGLEYIRSEHEVRYRQALFDLLLKQYDAAKLDESKDAAVIQVLEPAIEPDRKSQPKRLVIMLLFVFGGLILGCLLALCQWQIKLMHSNAAQAQRLQRLKEAFMGRKETMKI